MSNLIGKSMVYQLQLKTTTMSEPIISILVVDDEEGPRESLKMVLKSYYRVELACNGSTALKRLESPGVDLVTVDLRMPVMDGMELLKQIKQRYPEIDVLIITGFATLKSAAEGIRKGATDYLMKPFNEGQILSTIRQTVERKKLFLQLKAFLASLGAQRELRRLAHPPVPAVSPLDDFDHHFRTLIERQSESATDLAGALAILVGLLEKEGPHSPGHAERVARYAGMLAEPAGLDAGQKRDLYLAALLHNVGTVAVNVTHGDPEEQEELFKQHPIKGAELASTLPLSKEALEGIRYHHEHWNGSGYPEGRSRDRVPMMARILRLGEAIDEMMHACPVSEVVRRIRDGAGKIFDPKLAEYIIERIEQDPAFLVKPRRTA